jgi:hypothetical protein
MKPRGATAAAALALALGSASPARAQISPGRLSRAHAKLEGSGQCLQCHDREQGIAPAKCLACHKPLQQRIAAGKGLHARPEYGDCKRCHVEHQGEDAELVWWGKQGRAAFDHAQTGHALAGKHAQLSCERCHKPPSYVGLTTACASCHQDEHHGQFAGRACDACHVQTAWKPATGFDHAKTRWPLAGRHAQVGCDKCHTSRQPDRDKPGVTYRVFRVVAGTDCASCHKDPHAGRLGTTCTSCHTPAGWRGGMLRASAGFDHARTGYRLEGRHAALACEKCHLPGRPMRLPHAACTDCHQDPHASGPPARTAEAGRCERCHDVSGFKPSRFGPAEHAKTGYPLTGAHLAVPCDACHRPAAGRKAIPLRISGARCADCHRDPHRGEVDRHLAKGGCESCHKVESWRAVAFDHGQARFPLAGAHAKVACGRCHRVAESPGVTASLKLVGLATSCEGCHRDPHLGQFARAGQPVACERCHTTETIRATRFDHSRDAAWKLDGAHARLPCSACHKPEQRGAVTFVRYKPLPTKCSGCHADRNATQADGGRP